MKFRLQFCECAYVIGFPSLITVCCCFEQTSLHEQPNWNVFFAKVFDSALHSYWLLNLIDWHCEGTLLRSEWARSYGFGRARATSPVCDASNPHVSCKGCFETDSGEAETVHCYTALPFSEWSNLKIFLTIIVILLYGQIQSNSETWMTFIYRSVKANNHSAFLRNCMNEFYSDHRKSS
jgi:hypothetical protein